MLAYFLGLVRRILWPGGEPERALRKRDPARGPELEVLEDRRMMSANPATTPEPGLGIVGQAETYVQQMPKGNPSTIFLGDSITNGLAYGYGTPVWQSLFAPLNSLDLAVSGQTTANILYQLENGLLNGTAPAVIVLMIGTNNLLGGETPVETAEGIVADTMVIHEFAPSSQILVLGVPPTTYLPPSVVNETNWVASTFLGYLPFVNQIDYADVGQIFQAPDGTILPGALVDGIHPSEAGYALEANALSEPLFYAYTGYYVNLLRKQQEARSSTN